MKNDNCVFCGIVSGQIPAQKEYEDEQILAFKDVKPAARTHVLVIPKNHIENFEYLDTQHQEIVGKLQMAVGQLVRKLNIADGYKVVVNGGQYQQVKHMHYHLLAGLEKGGII